MTHARNIGRTLLAPLAWGALSTLGCDPDEGTLNAKGFSRPDEVPQVGIWINRRGWAPPGREPYANLALEPAIGAPDSLEEAVLDWRTAPSLDPGEERSWGLEVWLLEEGED